MMPNDCLMRDDAPHQPQNKVRRPTLNAMSADKGMSAVFERMPTFLVQCSWPDDGFHPSQVCTNMFACYA